MLPLLGACGAGSQTAPHAVPLRTPPAPPPTLPLDADALRRELQKRGAGRVADQLAKLAQPCLLLLPRSGAAPASPTSRLGGVPDLPRDAPWPEWRGEALAFLAQLRLEELPAHVVPGLPPRGVLCFFYDAGQSAFGLTEDDRGCARVLFSAHAAECEPREPPPALPASARYREVPVQAERALSLPDRAEPALGAPRLDDVEDEALGEIAHELHWRGAGHQVGGHPLPIQDSAMAASLARQIDGDRGRASDWLLLLQLESDGAPGWMWGDAGALYFWIRRDDLEALAFDRVWLVFECH